LVVAKSLARDPILAIAAMKIAPEHPEREGVASGESVKEWLFFDRIDLHTGHVASRHSQLTLFIKANPANTGSSGKNLAAVPTGEATNLILLATYYQFGSR